MDPFHRMFSLDNLAIQYPHAEVERVPVRKSAMPARRGQQYPGLHMLSAFLFLYAGAIPLALIIIWALVLRPTIHKAHVTILGFIISLILTSFLTDVVKNSVGRPRPDLIARCKPVRAR